MDEREGSPVLSRWFERAALPVLVLAFFLLALGTIGRFDYYPSEQNVLGPALQWLGRAERFKQKYPPLSACLYYPFLALSGRIGAIREAVPAHSVARFVTLLLSCGSIYLMWRLARRIGGGRFAILAAFFLAADQTFFVLSQLAQPEALLAFLVILHMHLSLSILRTGKTGYYLGAAVVAAAAVATKYFGLALVLPVAAHVLRSLRSGKTLARSFLSARLGLLIVAAPVALLVFVPDIEQFVEKIYPTVRSDAYFTNVGPCCMRLPQVGPYRAFLWPMVVLLPYAVGLLGYLAAVGGMGLAMTGPAGGKGDDRKSFLRLLLLYVVVVFAALQFMTSYFAPHTFTALLPAFALFSASAVDGAAGWAANRFPGRAGRWATVAIWLLVLAGTLPGIYSVTSFYEVISTNGNRAKALLSFAASSLAARRPLPGRVGAFGGGFDMVASSRDLEELADREPAIVFLMDCFVENTRKRAAGDPHCARLGLFFRSVRGEERYVQVAQIRAPDWWGRRLYERIDPELSLDMRFYVHRSIFEQKAVDTMLAEFEQRYDRARKGGP